MEKAKSNKNIAPDSAKVSKVEFNDASSKPEKGTFVKKKNTQAGDPTIKDAAVRKHVTSPGARGGARYGINVKFQKQVAPEAGATQGNGRLLSPAKPQSPNFKSGMAE